MNRKSGCPEHKQPSLSILPMLQFRAHRCPALSGALTHTGRRKSLPQHHVLRNHSVGNKCKPARFRPAIARGDPDQDVVHIAFRILDEHVEVSILAEICPCPSVQTPARFCLRLRFSSSSRVYGNSSCGYLYSMLHVAVRRRGVEIKIIFLHIFAVIALGSRSARTDVPSGSDRCHSTTPAQSRSCW